MSYVFWRTGFTEGAFPTKERRNQYLIQLYRLAVLPNGCARRRAVPIVLLLVVLALLGLTQRLGGQLLKRASGGNVSRDLGSAPRGAHARPETSG